jgi:PHD/YefM family antitoxin component YafN of YafNO toxin-antitoxin module
MSGCLSVPWCTLAPWLSRCPLAAVVAPFQSLVRRAARQRERITIVDPDQPSAVVISAEELEDLEDALAVAQSRLRETDGETVWVAHEEVKQRLGFDR